MSEAGRTTKRILMMLLQGDTGWMHTVDISDCQSILEQGLVRGPGGMNWRGAGGWGWCLFDVLDRYELELKFAEHKLFLIFSLSHFPSSLWIFFMSPFLKEYVSDLFSYFSKNSFLYFISFFKLWMIIFFSLNFKGSTFCVCLKYMLINNKEYLLETIWR